ncbi:hypothetical protein MNBD_ACTINO01-2153 [hydrothermal vent metagenome]|uniref:Uncharacterized protein n=1 Tax=hydrothermal vent metagenome TaxID=652676 RepID=A0A3B0SLZ6_9ZZZZ
MDGFTIDDTQGPSTQSPDVCCSTVSTFPGEPITAVMREEHIADLEDQIRELVADEPKDFAKATILIYDVFRLRDEPEQALEVARLLDLPAVVLFQVPPLVRAILEMGPTPTTATLDAALERIDDLGHLVIMVLDGDTDADIVRQLVDLSEAVRTPLQDPRRVETISAAADRLTHHVNAFFFDRLTAIPELRTYVVGLELGL